MDYSEIRRVLKLHLFCDYDCLYGSVAAAISSAVTSADLEKLKNELDHLKNESPEKIEEVLNDHDVHLWDSVTPQDLLVTMSTLARLIP